MEITTKELSCEQLTSFISEYIRERGIDVTGLNIETGIGCVMNDDMFETLCQEMDNRIHKMTKGVRQSVRHSGRSYIRPILKNLIPVIPRIDERVVLASAYQQVFGGVK